MQRAEKLLALYHPGLAVEVCVAKACLGVSETSFLHHYRFYQMTKPA
jgi:hypothetical protein